MRYADVFNLRRALLPVVHVTGVMQAIDNVGVARDAGAPGVFLIGHEMPCAELLGVYAEVRLVFPGYWIGVNVLDEPIATVYATIDSCVDGVWADEIGVRYMPVHPLSAESQYAARRTWGKRAPLFGGVAFKYQSSHPLGVDVDTRESLPFLDVVTTSGDATGLAPAPEKIRLMHDAIAGRCPLAIASGVSVANVAEFLPYAWGFLVASSISRGFDRLDFLRTRSLVEAVAAWCEANPEDPRRKVTDHA